MVSTKTFVAIFLVAIASKHYVSSASISATANQANELVLRLDESMLHFTSSAQNALASAAGKLDTVATSVETSLQNVFSAAIPITCGNTNIQSAPIFSTAINGFVECTKFRIGEATALFKYIANVYQTNSVKIHKVLEDLGTCKLTKCLKKLEPLGDSSFALAEKFFVALKAQEEAIRKSLSNYKTCLIKSFDKFTADCVDLAQTIRNSCPA